MMLGTRSSRCDPFTREAGSPVNGSKGERAVLERKKEGGNEILSPLRDRCLLDRERFRGSFLSPPCVRPQAPLASRIARCQCRSSSCASAPLTSIRATCVRNALRPRALRLNRDTRACTHYVQNSWLFIAIQNMAIYSREYVVPLA